MSLEQELRLYDDFLLGHEVIELSERYKIADLMQDDIIDRYKLIDYKMFDTCLMQYRFKRFSEVY